MRRLRAREGNRQTEWGCCEGYVFILNTGLPHRDNQRLPGECTFKKNRVKMRSLGHSIIVFFFFPSRQAEVQTTPLVHSTCTASWQVTNAKLTFLFSTKEKRKVLPFAKCTKAVFFDGSMPIVKGRALASHWAEKKEREFLTGTLKQHMLLPHTSTLKTGFYFTSFSPQLHTSLSFVEFPIACFLESHLESLTKTD